MKITEELRKDESIVINLSVREGSANGSKDYVEIEIQEMKSEKKDTTEEAVSNGGEQEEEKTENSGW